MLAEARKAWWRRRFGQPEDRQTLLDRQVEAAREVWFDGDWAALCGLVRLAAPAYADFVEQARARMRLWLLAARKVRQNTAPSSRPVPVRKVHRPPWPPVG